MLLIGGGTPARNAASFKLGVIKEQRGSRFSVKACRVGDVVKGTPDELTVTGSKMIGRRGELCKSFLRVLASSLTNVGSGKSPIFTA